MLKALGWKGSGKKVSFMNISVLNIFLNKYLSVNFQNHLAGLCLDYLDSPYFFLTHAVTAILKIEGGVGVEMVFEISYFYGLSR